MASGHKVLISMISPNIPKDEFITMFLEFGDMVTMFIDDHISNGNKSGYVVYETKLECYRAISKLNGHQPYYLGLQYGGIVAKDGSNFEKPSELSPEYSTPTPKTTQTQQNALQSQPTTIRQTCVQKSQDVASAIFDSEEIQSYFSGSKSYGCQKYSPDIFNKDVPESAATGGLPNSEVEGDRRRAAKVNRRQLSVMVNFMAEHREFACGRFVGPQGKVGMARRWEEMKDILNQHGRPKTIGQWKRAWKDLKMKVRAANARVNASKAMADNVQAFQQPLSNLEQQVLGIIETQTSTPAVAEKPVAITSETGAADEMDQVEILLDPFEVIIGSMEQPSTSHAVPATPTAASPPTRSQGIKEEIDDIHRRLDAHEHEKISLLKSIAESNKVLADCSKESLGLQAKAIEMLKELLEKK